MNNFSFTSMTLDVASSQEEIIIIEHVCKSTSSKLRLQSPFNIGLNKQYQRSLFSKLPYINTIAEYDDQEWSMDNQLESQCELSSKDNFTGVSDDFKLE
ncbi:hypothetical protein SS50377_24991 [Spironucleus salmonicida]|uniref:Uncharacterized protein n=1 Tax=Spironucleus salmonicida TaxID=348837 RepID=V6LXX8_9EUKA|nr:hypothetical protein SS50377_24991 [Spironucleus salmonicida]|eukprot:EST49108.1 Hypothetical protein SS50377_10591 [Spironucleus salmonicida]